MIELLKSDPTLWEQFSQYFTEQQLRDDFFLTGVTMTGSGAFAAFTALLCIIKRFYVVALIACIISSIFALPAIIGVVGFIVAYLIYRARNEFKDYSPKTT